MFEVKILGSNSASFAYNRHQTSQIVSVNQNLYMIDCGEGTQLQLLKYRIKLNRINHIFISHLHGDHYFGLIGVLSTMHLQGRTNELHLYAPTGLDEILVLQFKHSDTKLNFVIHYHRLDTEVAQIILDNESLTVETIPLDHRINCCGFLFKEKPKHRRLNREALPPNLKPFQIYNLKFGHDVYGENGELLFKNEELTTAPKHRRSYAFCSDTKYNERIIAQIDGVDLLYHESTFMSDMADRAEATHHSTAQQAATIALKANVKRLMLGHYSSRYKDLLPLLLEAKAIFENTILSTEGETLTIADEDEPGIPGINALFLPNEGEL